MQSTTTKRAVVIAGCTNLGMNEEQPTQGGEFSCATKPAICIPPSVSACYRRSHRRRPSRDLPAESMCFDVSTFRLAVPLRVRVPTQPPAYDVRCLMAERHTQRSLTDCPLRLLQLAHHPPAGRRYSMTAVG
jgi:hypothetical protein